ncbi:hypothetical protein DENSPDRAFT_805921 [Dentipellis sp. KUC8613]|nr:hypothetical protein DENSPDRAFT_805921 [Dentipellis sp. KUC8613]
MVSNKLASHLGFTSTYHPLDVVKEKMYTESCSAFLGPMDPRDFLKAFVPPPAAQVNGQQRKIPEVSFKDVSKSTNEHQMYKPFIKICEKLDEDNVMRFYDTHATSDLRTVPSGSPEREGLSPDIMTYRRTRCPKNGRLTDFCLAERADEFKFKTDKDPFDDKPNKSDFPFESCTLAGKNTRGQITAYAAAMLELQFRTFVFSIFIMGDFARLIRWDRSGAIVTRAFNYQDDPEPLAQFIWRYNFLSRAQRGFDESVKVIEITDNTTDLSEARKELRKYVPPKVDQNQEIFLLRMIPLSTSSEPLPLSGQAPSGPSIPPTRSFYAHDPRSTDGWDYYVTAPHMSDRGPFGRMTRSLYVYDRVAKRVRHLKDTNRIISPKHTVEHEIINELGEKKVRHISTVHAAWDVATKGECYDTVTPTFCNNKSIDPQFAPPEVGYFKAQRVYRHYRLITNELGVPLWVFTNWKQVIRALIDAMEALDDAEKAGWRHRDVSVGNVMIHGDHGLLIDWDASQRSADMNCGNPARVPDLTGTWQFMSLRRLRDSSGRHDSVDDLESVFWVLLWLALNYSVHTLPPDALKNLLQFTFDDSRFEGGHYKGGNGKDLLFRSGFNERLPTNFLPQGLHAILKILHHAFKIQPPAPLDIEGLPDYVAEIEKNDYEDLLSKYRRQLALLKDSTYLRSLLLRTLEQYEWPTQGPVEHPLPPDDKGSQTTPTWSSSRSGSLPSRVAEHPPPFPNTLASGSSGRAKVMRTGVSSDSKVVTHYDTMDESDEEGEDEDEDA